MRNKYFCFLLTIVSFLLPELSVVNLTAYGTSSQEDKLISISEPNDNVIKNLQDIKSSVASLDPTIFKASNRQDRLVNKYDTVIRNIQVGRYDLALKKLKMILFKINGCKYQDQSDGNDLITDCEAQRLIYDNTEETIIMLSENVTTEARELVKESQILSITQGAKVWEVAWGWGVVLGVVKYDASENGIADTNKSGIPYPSMSLYNSSRRYNFIGDSNGNYKSPPVVPDTYTLQALASGYVTQSKSVTLNTYDIKEVNFALTR